MLLNNLELSFDRQEGSKYIFINQAGQEVILEKDIFSETEMPNKKIFLSMDIEPLVSATEDKKKTLNEILGS